MSNGKNSKRNRIIAAVVALCLLAASISVIARPDQNWFRQPEAAQQGASRLEKYLAEQQVPQEKAEEALWRAQQVSGGLREIQRTAGNAADPLRQQEREEERLQRLSGAYDEESGAYWQLRLEEELGSMEDALNEYLYCLQAGISLELMESDREAYDKAVEEKQIMLRREEAVTYGRIEELMLESLRGAPQQEDAQPGAGAAAQPGAAGIPKAPAAAPAVRPENLVPENPAEQAMSEVEAVTRSWMR